MKLIPLTQGKFSMVDDEDYERLVGLKWAATSPKRHGCYAVRSVRIGGRETQFKMHRVILGLTDPRIHVDHKDRNGLNNTKENLRRSDLALNARNRGPRRGSSSRFVGVCWSKKSQKWQAAITVAGKQSQIGTFSSEVDAAMARDVAAMEHHGEFACLNFVQ